MVPYIRVKTTLNRCQKLSVPSGISAVPDCVKQKTAQFSHLEQLENQKMTSLIGGMIEDINDQEIQALIKQLEQLQECGE